MVKLESMTCQSLLRFYLFGLIIVNDKGVMIINVVTTYDRFDALQRLCFDK